MFSAHAWTSQRLCLFIVQVAHIRDSPQTVLFIVQVAYIRDATQTVPFIVQVAHVKTATQTVPFIVQSVQIMGSPQTVPVLSHLGIHAQDSPRRVSVLPLLVPALIFIFRHPESPCLGCALDAILPLAPTVAH